MAIEFSAPPSRLPDVVSPRPRIDRTESGLSLVQNELITPREQRQITAERARFSETKPVDQIRAVSWNVLFTSTPEQIAEPLTRIELDHGLVHVVCAQEIPVDPATLGTQKSDENAQEVAERLGMPYVHFTPQTWLRHNRLERDPEKKDEELCSGPAIFSRYPFVEGSEAIYLLGEGRGGPDFYRDRYGHALLLTADVQIPTLDTQTGEETLTTRRVGTYHLSTSSEMPWKRAREVRNLAGHLEDCDLAFGDANARPGSRYAKTIFEALPRVDSSDEHTYEDKFFGVNVRRKLDYGGAREGIKVVSSTKIKEKGNSDHFPTLYAVNM